MKSSRLTPNQFAAGLTLDATRLEHDLVALANRYSAPPDTDLARRWVETHMVYGFLPTAWDSSLATPVNEELPQALPWMGAYNPQPYGTAAAGTAAAAIAPPYTSPVNAFRAKGNHQDSIDPAAPSAYLNGTLLQWETSWTQTGPCLFDSLRIVMATDAFYSNAFVWGANAGRIGKVPGATLDDISVQVIVDSALANERRDASLLPLLFRDFRADSQDMALSFYSAPDGMQPPPVAKGEVATTPTGLCIDLFPRQPIPEDARVRVILTLPVYDGIADAMPPQISSFGQYPWQTFVLSGHVTLLQPLEDK